MAGSCTRTGRPIPSPSLWPGSGSGSGERRPGGLAPACRLQARDVRGHALPAAIAQLPVVGVAAGTLRSVRFLVGGARVDDGKVAEDADDDVVLANVAHCRSAADLGKEGFPID